MIMTYTKRTTSELFTPQTDIIKNKPTINKSRGKKKNVSRSLATKSPSSKVHSNANNSIEELKSTLRLECLRLADFLKQESAREGFVR